VPAVLDASTCACAGGFASSVAVSLARRVTPPSQDNGNFSGRSRRRVQKEGIEIDNTLHDSLKSHSSQLEHADHAARLDRYYVQIKAVILSRQHPVTGLLPASTAVNAHGDYTDAWVRDNVYSILAVWGLALAYRKVDEDQGRTFELEGCVVRLMRGLLFAMMRQAPKVEAFKQTQSPSDALHAKYGTRTGHTVVGDHQWGHLQLDATSLFLLMLGQMTASGLHLIFTIDEVNFVQNLIYYIGRAYQTPDYGIWERGNKINSGQAELNASSVGMAKAALESLNGLDLFGVRGSQASVLHALGDEVARSRMTLESLLPWESSSKEVDAALLSVIGFPAFAVEDAELAALTRTRIVERLQGRYGCKRFGRDGHQTVVEDHSRLHYEAGELKQFEGIESEWPLFFTYLLLDCHFRHDTAGVQEYRRLLNEVLVERDGFLLLPELYYVPAESIDAERARPHSQARVPNANVPLVWAQSLLYLGQMLEDGLLHRGDIDPLGRHHRVGMERRPVVQIALLCEDQSLQLELEAHGVQTQTPQQIAPLQVRRAPELAAAYAQIGRNDKLNLSGRPVRLLRSLTTSKLFRIRGQEMVFLPSFLDPQQFYLTLDEHFRVAQIKSEIAYLGSHWRQAGRPTMTLLLSRTMWESGREALLEWIGELQEGRCGEVAVRLGPLHQFSVTAGRERIDFLHDFEFEEASLQDATAPTHRLPEPTANAPLSSVEEFLLEQESDPQVLVARLAASNNIYERVEVLQNLARGRSLQWASDADGPLQGVSVEVLLDELYVRATQGDQDGRPLWSIVRRVAGLLGKTDIGLADAVTDIVVRQKQITVGKAYFEAALISRPMPAAEIMGKIRHFAGEDVRELVLSQEILIFLSLLIKTEPKLLAGLLTLRVNYLILLLISELSNELDIRQDEAFERLMQSSPSEIQRRLRLVLARRESTIGLLKQQESLRLHSGHSGGLALPDEEPEEPQVLASAPAPIDGWLRLREREGALNRVPTEFYGQVWSLLHHCEGLVIGDKLEQRNRLDSGLILGEMTSGEKNFAVWVEHLLNKIEFPEYRHLNIEAIVALASVVESHPGLRIEDSIVLDVLIGHAVRLSWLEAHPERAPSYDEDKPAAWRRFYESRPQTLAYFIVQALHFLSES
jgi:phosphorylase kinase alpha/beta subunit